MMKTTRPVYGCSLARLASLSDTTLVQPLFGGSDQVLGRLKCLTSSLVSRRISQPPPWALPLRPGWLEMAALAAETAALMSLETSSLGETVLSRRISPLRLSLFDRSSLRLASDRHPYLQKQQQQH